MLENDLPWGLMYRDDPDVDAHGFIEPRREMPIERYVALLETTRMAWVKAYLDRWR
jgi:hypothetical protein